MRVERCRHWIAGGAAREGSGSAASHEGAEGDAMAPLSRTEGRHRRAGHPPCASAHEHLTGEASHGPMERRHIGGHRPHGSELSGPDRRQERWPVPFRRPRGPPSDLLGDRRNDPGAEQVPLRRGGPVPRRRSRGPGPFPEHSIAGPVARISPSPTKPWPRPVRIVLDTNVFVSALIAREGPPGRLLREPPGDPSEIGNHE